MNEVFDLAGLQVRPLSWITDKITGSQYASLVNGEMVSIHQYKDSAEWGIRRDNGLGGSYIARSKEEAIKLCNAWNRSEVMLWLEEI